MKERAAVALKQAKAYHDTARQQLLAGQTVDAARRFPALRRCLGSDEAVFTDEPTLAQKKENGPRRVLR